MDALPVLAGLGVGVAAGLCTPPLARRFAVGTGRWGWVATGAATGALLGWRLAGQPPALLAWLVVLAVGLPLAAIDLGAHRLPDLLTLPAWLAVAVVAVAGGGHRALPAGLALALAAAALAVLPRSALGFGDVKLAGGLGTALGLLGWADVGWGAVYAVLLGGVVALALLATGRVCRDTPLPFGPALLAGATLAALTAG